MSVPDWADTYRRLSSSSGAIGGPWQTERVEVARGPMSAVKEPGVEVITCMTCTQLLKTSLMENVIGYFAHLDPAPMLLVEPKDEAVEAFSKERLAPMVQASPELRALMSDRRTRLSDDTLRFKSFPGGFLALASAGSPTNLAMRAVRVVLEDEVDKYEPTKEGDPITLAEERTATFGRSALAIRACSPTWEETSRIYRSYQESDMRRPYALCPHCGEWVDLDFFRHVHWDKDEAGEGVASTAAIFCDQCGGAWSEADRLSSVSTRGRVRHQQTRPFTCCGVEQRPAETRSWEWDEGAQCGYATCTECGRRAVSNRHAGFTASKLFSPFTSVERLAARWLADKADPDTKQTFYNTQLGRPFRAEVMREVDRTGLMARAERYQAQAPEGVLVVTAGVDVQGGGSANEGRLEAEIVGWGVGEESWSLGHHVLHGDPAGAQVWAELDRLLLAPIRHERGFDVYVAAACVDSGGLNTNEVYSFCKPRLGRSVWAIKGASDRGGQWSPIWPARAKESRKYRTGYRPVILGVNAGKEAVRQRLLVEEPGPGYCHFPIGREQGWYEQLTAEELTLERRGGQSVRKWHLQKGRANEAFDTRVYAYAALHGLYHTQRLNLERQAERLAGQEPAERPRAQPGASQRPTASAAPPPARRRPRQSAWAQG
jgi:phage terminase large subunit GpA-like protein